MTKFRNEADIRECNPCYVDVMETWSTVLMALWAVTSVVIGISSSAPDEYEWLPLYILAAAFVIGVCWLPGLLLFRFRRLLYECATIRTSAYAKTYNLFGGGSWRLKHLQIGGNANIAAILVMLVLAGLVTIMNWVGVTLDAEALNLAIIFGAILSWGGACIVGVRILWDIIHGWRQIRPVL